MHPKHFIAYIMLSIFSQFLYCADTTGAAHAGAGTIDKDETGAPKFCDLRTASKVEYAAGAAAGAGDAPGAGACATKARRASVIAANEAHVAAYKRFEKSREKFYTAHTTVKAHPTNKNKHDYSYSVMHVRAACTAWLAAAQLLSDKKEDCPQLADAQRIYDGLYNKDAKVRDATIASLLTDHEASIPNNTGTE